MRTLLTLLLVSMLVGCSVNVTPAFSDAELIEPEVTTAIRAVPSPEVEVVDSRLVIVNPIEFESYLIQADANADIADQNAAIIANMARERNALVLAGRAGDEQAQALADVLAQARRENAAHRILWAVAGILLMGSAMD